MEPNLTEVIFGKRRCRFIQIKLILNWERLVWGLKEGYLCKPFKKNFSRISRSKVYHNLDWWKFKNMIKKNPTVIEIIVIVLLRLNLLQMNNQWCIGSESFEGSNFYIGIIGKLLPQKNSFLQNQIWNVIVNLTQFIFVKWSLNLF